MLHKHKTAVILITLIMLVVAGLSSYHLISIEIESRKVVPLIGARLLSDTGTDTASGLAWSPDSKTLAVARHKYSDGGDPPVPVESYIDLLDVEKLSSYTLEKTRSTEQAWPTADFATITGVCWSPKQNQIVFVRAASIWLINLDNEQAPTRLGDGEACAWSKDGKTLAVIEDIFSEDKSLRASKIYTLDVGTGKKQEIYSQSTILGNTIAWAPDNNHLAFVENYTPNATLNILDLDSGTRKMLIYSHAITSLTWSPDGKMLSIIIESLPSSERYYVRKLTIIKADGGSILWESSVLEGLNGYSTWSPDGKTIAFVNNWNVYALDVDALLKNK